VIPKWWCSALVVVTHAAAPAVASAQTGCDGVLPITLLTSSGTTPEASCFYTIHYGPPAWNKPITYLVLVYPDCNEGVCQLLTGANAVNCTTRHGYACCIGLGQIVDVAPGSYAGPYRLAVNARFDTDSDLREGICYADYLGNGARVFTVPVSVLDGTRVIVVDFVRVFMSARTADGSSGLANSMQVLPRYATGTVDRAWGSIKLRYR
jgi:hypothetical protein